MGKVSIEIYRTLPASSPPPRRHYSLCISQSQRSILVYSHQWYNPIIPGVFPIANRRLWNPHNLILTLPLVNSSKRRRVSRGKSRVPVRTCGRASSCLCWVKKARQTSKNANQKANRSIATNTRYKNPRRHA